MPNPVVSDAPWSAAFISWVVKTAAQRAEGTAHAGLVFPYIAAHSQYAQAIRDNPTKYPIGHHLEPHNKMGYLRTGLR